jgi:hypothetical protein
MKYTLGLDRMF